MNTIFKQGINRETVVKNTLKKLLKSLEFLSHLCYH